MYEVEKNHMNVGTGLTHISPQKATTSCQE